MKLIKVHFDAYKSLFKETLELQDSCIGFVGINEAGKSNILNAMRVLSPENSLGVSDTPKMENKANPCIRFEFLPNNEERAAIVDLVQELTGRPAKDSAKLLTSDLTITYHVLFNKAEDKERRFFSATGFGLPRNGLVLRRDAVTDGYLIKRGETFVPLSEAVLITEKEIESNEKIRQASEDLAFTVQQITDFVEAREQQIQKEPPTVEAEPEAQDDDAVTETEPGVSVDSETEKVIAAIEKKRVKLQAKVEGFDLYQCIAQANNDIAELDVELKEITTEIDTIKSKPEEPEQPEDTKEKELKTLSKRKATALRKRHQNQKLLDALEEPLRDKYSGDAEELDKYLSSIEPSLFESHLPEVVFWQPNNDYILQGETEFKDIMAAKTKEDIPRPLVNLFRIGLETKELEEIQAKIAEIQHNASERIRDQEKLNTRINNYLKAVWPDYDQKIKISLEKERILVQFFDPSCAENASFFEMQERSQGCQTFISFLLTIGAEAKEGIIKNTVLLLDEPETHLHPSGVRFMLRELIKAAKNGNNVLFATHSIFNIDRDNYNRHIILKKKKELTSIQPSQRERIGFFMQEEVLYSGLDVNLSEDFSSTEAYNFVFEGEGDTTLFEHIYANILDENERPFDQDITATRFYPGGGCSNIRKYFTRKPIQLGTTWVFILDRDGPANELRSLIEGKYHKFINDYIYVFQYRKKDSEEPIELEDLLPKKILSKTLLDTVAELNADASIKWKPSTGTAFAQYFEILADQFQDQDKFKEVFKRTLNAQLSSSTLEKSSEEDIKKTFSEYCSWVSSVMQDIKKAPDEEDKEEDESAE